MDKAYKTLGVTDLNAHTSNEETVYECDMPRNRLEAWAKLEGDRFSRPVFRLFQSEIEAVYEEKNRSMDNPGSIVWEALDKALYGEHPYAVPVIGTVEHLKNPSLAKMYAFYNAHYVPNNMAVVLAGDFEPAEALALVAKHFGAWKPAPLSAAAHPAVPAATAPVRVEVRYEAEETGFIVWPTVPNGHPDEDAVSVMDMVASNAETGLIDLRLNQAQKVKQAGSFPHFLNEAGAWFTYFLPKEGQTLEQAEALVLEAVEALKKGEFTEADLKANVLNFEIGEKLKLESNEARVGELVSTFIDRADWAVRAKRLERLRKVDKAEVLRVAEKYLGAGRVVVYRRKGKPEVPSISKPGFTKIEIAPGRESAFYREVVGTPAKEIEPKWVLKGVDYLERRIPGGKLYWTKNPMNDLFAMSFVFERGWRAERKLCAAVELVDKAGAGDLPAEAFKRKLYALGLSMSFSCGERTSGVSLSGPEANLEAGLELLRQRLQLPALAPDAKDKMVEIWVGQHKDNKVNPGSIGGALSQWAQRGDDSAVLAELTDAELKALTEAELKALLKDFMAWERRVTYVGSRDADAVAGLLKEKGAAYKPVPPARAMTYQKPTAPRVVFTHRDMVQSQVGLFAADGVFNPDELVDGYFYRDYMGGGMGSVVFQEVREARSLAYSAWGGYVPGGQLKDENRLLGSLGTQADKTVEAVDLLAKLLKEPPLDAARFKQTKDAVLQSYRTDPLTFRQIPGAVLTWEDQGFAKDPRPARYKRSQGYALKDLEAFSQRFKSKVLTTHILGNKERVKLEELKKFGALEEKTVDDLFPY
ncbi:MAG: insulinase family protein [Elusimicrobia bacterium]|nr:insulinase family protein [Elusimicrobiota bacterium]